MSVQENLRPTHNKKIFGAMKAEHAIKHITFDHTEANPGETLYISVPKLNENEVIVPGLLALCCDIDLSGGHTNNFLVQNVTRVLVDKMVVKFAGTIRQDTVSYDICKIFEDIFLSQEKRDNMLLEGIQSKDLCKIRSGAGDKKISGIAAENKLNDTYRSKFSHQARPTDPDRPWRFLSPGPLQQPRVRNNPCTSFTGSQRL